MSNIAFEIVAIFLLLIANGVFAMAEIAVVAARKSRLQDLADKGMAKARAALELAKSPNQFLSTVQIGITLVGILAGAFGGRALTEWIATRLSAVPMLAPYSEMVGLSIVVLGITYFSVIIGELVPKRLALSNPEGIAMAVARPEEEITTLLQQGTAAGVFEESEQDMVEAVFRLGDKSARTLMTPRTQIVWLDVNESIERIRVKLSETGQSRFPLAAGRLDNVIGVVQAKDLLANLLAGKALDLKGSMQQAAFVPRSMKAFQVLEHIKRSGSHIVLVVDEYGGIEGLLTHHDVLEAIAGDMPFGKSPVKSKAVQRADGSWLLDGMLSVDEFKEIFHLESLPGENKDAYQTLGGFIFTQIGRVPSVADTFEWNNLRFEVVDMDNKRIDKVLVTAVPKNSPHLSR